MATKTKTTAKATKVKAESKSKDDIALKNGGISNMQLRILQFGAAAKKGFFTREEYLAKNPGDDAFFGDNIGRIDPDVRKAREAKTGKPSLLTLKLASVDSLDVDGKSETIFKVTAAGKQAIVKAEKANALRDAE
jgi:hypothetical protein